MTVSTEYTAGRILVLVGAILAILSGLLLLFMMSMMFGMMRMGGADPPMPFGFGFFPLFFGSFMLLSLAGAVVGLLAYRTAPHDPRKAGILGIVASVLPPTNLISLIGGILLLLSPEAKAQAAQAKGQWVSADQPPR